MVGDPDPLVRYQLAFSLGALPGTKPAAALAALAVRDGADPWMRVAILSSVTACTGEVFHRLADDAGFRSSRHGRAIPDHAGGADRRREPPGRRGRGPRGRWTARWPETRLLTRDIVAGTLEQGVCRVAGPACRGRRRPVEDDPRRDPGRRPRDRGRRIAARRPRGPPPSAVVAIRGVRGRAATLLAELLASRQPPAVQTAAIETLARFDDVRAARSCSTHGPR